MKNKQGFTLAEVLITLGVIGIVAALTIPQLIKNYQKNILKQQFKKAYSTISLALQKAEYDLGGNVNCYYNSAKFDPNSSTTMSTQVSECSVFFDAIANNFNSVKKCVGNPEEAGCFPKGGYKGGEKLASLNCPEDQKEEAEDYYNRTCQGYNTYYIKHATSYLLNDGLIIFSYGSGNMPLFAFDINGHKGPNKWGYDVFSIALVKNTLKSGIILKPSSGCQPVEKGGVKIHEFMNDLYK